MSNCYASAYRHLSGHPVPMVILHIGARSRHFVCTVSMWKVQWEPDSLLLSSHMRQQANLQSVTSTPSVRPPVIPWKPSAQKEVCIVLHLCVLSVEAQSVDPSQGCLPCGTHNRSLGGGLDKASWDSGHTRVKRRTIHHLIQFRLHLSMIHLTSQHTNSQLKFPPRLPSYNTKLVIGASVVCKRESCAQLPHPLGGRKHGDYKILRNLVLALIPRRRKAPPNHSLS